MQYEFDWCPEKAKENLKKHKISFSFATRVFLDPHRIERLDERDDHGEDRYVVLAKIDDVACLVVVYTDRANVTRLISARKAEPNEREKCEKASRPLQPRSVQAT
jgi:uncharacterized DUF497 family protein